MHSLGKNQSAPDETESTVLGRGRQDGLILPQMPLGHHKDLSSFDAAIYALNQLSRQVVDANGESKTGIGTVNPNRYIAMSNEVDLGDLDLAGSIVVGKQIIWGNFSDIFQGTILKDGSEIMVAIKSLRFHGPAGQAAHDRLRKRFFREILLWRTLQHRNIVPLLGYTLPLDSPPTLVSPWYQGGNVIFYLQSCLDPDRRTLALDVVNGLEYLHSVPIVHGDLKGENVLVDANGRASLCDFGMAQFVDEATRIIGFTTSTGGAGGTDRFMCPELWNGAPKSAATDMWAIGSLIVQILTDEIPYHHLTTKQALFSAIMRGEPPSTCRNVAIDTALWDSTRKCWSTMPDERPKISEVGIHLAPLEDFVTAEVLKTLSLVVRCKISNSNYGFSRIKFSPDGKYLAVASAEHGTVSIWDAGKKVLPKPLRSWNLGKIGGTGDRVLRVVWSASQCYVLLMLYSYTKVFAVETGNLLLDMNHSEIAWANFLPDGDAIVILGKDGILSIQDLSRKETALYPVNWGSHQFCHGIAFFPDKQRVRVVTSMSLLVYNVKTAKVETSAPLPHDPISKSWTWVSKDGRFALVSRGIRGPELWGINLSGADQVAELSFLHRYTSPDASSLGFPEAQFGGTSDEIILGVLYAAESIICIWDRDTATLLHSFKPSQFEIRDISLRWCSTDATNIMLAVMTRRHQTDFLEMLSVRSGPVPPAPTRSSPVRMVPTHTVEPIPIPAHNVLSPIMSTSEKSMQGSRPPALNDDDDGEDNLGNWNHGYIAAAMQRNPEFRLAADRTSGFRLRREQVILVGTEPIAKGSYGIVWKGELHSFEQSFPWKPLIISVAIKVIHAQVVDHDHERLLKSLFREIIPQCGLEEHPNVVPIQGYLLRGDSAWIVTSWQAHGNATDFLRENNGANRLSLILDVVSGLCHLHSRQPPIVHGDLKGDNVLIGADHTAKLADFGLARILEDTLEAAYTTSSALRGCIYFLAPELLSGCERTLKSDIWALGGLILQIASGCLPFHGMKMCQILDALYVRQAPNLDLYGEFPHKSLLRPIIEGCWGIGSKDRWSVFEVALYLRRHIPLRNL